MKFIKGTNREYVAADVWLTFVIAALKRTGDGLRSAYEANNALGVFENIFVEELLVDNEALMDTLRNIDPRKVETSGCMFDNIDPSKVTGLSCACPKCSPAGSV